MNPVIVILAFAAFVNLGLPDGLLGPSRPSMHRAVGVPIDASGAFATTTIGGYLLASSLSGANLRRPPSARSWPSRRRGPRPLWWGSA